MKSPKEMSDEELMKELKDVPDLDIDEEKLVAGIVEGYHLNKETYPEEVALVIEIGTNFMKKHEKIVRPKPGKLAVTPVGVYRISKQLINEPSHLMNAFVLNEMNDDIFEKEMKEWIYLLGFFITMKDLQKKKFLQIPYSKREYESLLKNTVGTIRMFEDVYGKISKGKQTKDSC